MIFCHGFVEFEIDIVQVLIHKHFTNVNFDAYGSGIGHKQAHGNISIEFAFKKRKNAKNKKLRNATVSFVISMFFSCASLCLSTNM